MDMTDSVAQIDTFIAVTMGIVAVFIGKRLNESISFLREFSIPEPVAGGLLFALIFAVLQGLTGYAVEFNLGARDFLLIYFFTTIGINARTRDLLEGGKPLLILLVITIGFMALQNITGIAIARLFNLPAAFGVIGGSISLIGGHGTAIAWAPVIAANHGISNAMEIGVASATLGLIMASLTGGPIAGFLIRRHKLKAAPTADTVYDVGVSAGQGDTGMSYMDFLAALLAIHVCIIIGFLLNQVIALVGLKLPLFVTCLLSGVLITNLFPAVLQIATGKSWPTRSLAIALIADISLGTFLAMSLMSMQIWTLLDLAGPLLVILAGQCMLAVLITLYILFPLMGRNYDTAVIAAGFCGYTLGATSTAMVNMAAVTKHFGPCHRAFIIVPIISAFFIDLSNALVIPFFLDNF